MKSHVFGLALLSVTAVVAGAPAHAVGTLTRTFVSSAGLDSNPCTITQPCATFAAAYAAVQNNGIVAALDPGKYGPLTNITTGVTINGNGWAAITAPAESNGITISAGTANVTFIGLEIDGVGAAYNGIVLNSAGSLTVTDCTLQNFLFAGGATGNGILMQPMADTLDFTIANTTVSNNGNAGINYNPPNGSPSANGVIDHVVANANQFGINVYAGNASAGTTVVAVSNSIASNNSNKGIDVDNGSSEVATKVSIDNVSATGNVTGVAAFDTANVLLGRSVITGNGTGVLNSTSLNTFYTYKDNRINLNTSSDGANTLATLSQQ